MNVIGKFFSNFKGFYNEINSATLTGAIDVVVVEQPDGSYRCSPFHVRFGKLGVLRSREKIVDIEVNGEPVDIHMKLGDTGEAFFVEEVSDDEEIFPSFLATSPLPDEVNEQYMANELHKLKMSIANEESSSEGKEASPERSESDSEKKASEECGKMNGVVAEKSNHVSDDVRYVEETNCDGFENNTYASSPESNLMNNADVPKGSFNHDLSTDSSSNSNDEVDTACESLRDISQRFVSIGIQTNFNGEDFVDTDNSKQNECGKKLVSIGVQTNLNNSNFVITASGTVFSSCGQKQSKRRKRKMLLTKENRNQIEMLKDNEIQKRSDIMEAYDIFQMDYDWDELPISHETEKLEIIEQTLAESELVENNNHLIPLRQDVKRKTGHYRKSLTLSTEQIKSLNLQEGENETVFSVTTAYQGTSRCNCSIYLWRYDDKIVISDIDGTITKSDVLGHILPILGKDWAQSGVANLFTKIRANGYRLLYLSARAIGQARTTREYLKSVRQGDLCLPDGPLLLSPTSLISAFHREVIEKKPEEFKISCLKDIQALFPSNPFYSGFGNKINDTWAYRAVGVPLSRIFTINYRGEVTLELIQLFQSSYTSLSDVVDQMFPPVPRNTIKGDDFLSEFSTFNYWKDPIMVVPVDDSLLSLKEDKQTSTTTQSTKLPTQ